MYWRWRKGKIGREDYLQEKRRFKKLLKKKQREKSEEEEEGLRSFKREVDIWKYINKKRDRKRHENSINKEQWKNHFKDLLGSKEAEREETEVDDKSTELEEEELKEKEIKKALKKET